MSRGKILRLTFSLTLLLLGIVFVLWEMIIRPSLFGELISKLGLSCIVTGIVTLFRELAILRLETEETGEDIATRVHKRISDECDLLMVTDKRLGFSGYYTWVSITDPQDLFFAGRSVLHSIDRDIKKIYPQSSAEEIMARKLKEKSNINIMFLDPKSNIIDRLAKEEGQQKKDMLSNIAASLGICERLYELIKNNKSENLGELNISVYNEVPYFAYHKEDNKVYVGFYFSTHLGSTTAAFSVENDQTKRLFEQHFTSIFSRISSQKNILEISKRRSEPWFNRALYYDLCNFLTQEESQAKKAFDGPKSPECFEV